jgi:hypothetical protein
MINGRPICLFKLHQPLQVAGWALDDDNALQCDRLQDR